MTKWNLIIDVAECHNCNNCVVAAKDELAGNRFAGYSAPHPAQGRGVIWIERRVRGSAHHVDAAYLPRLCNHCADAPCVRAAPGAVRQREDGIVVFDPDKCRGRRDLVDVCPYGAVVWNDAEQLPQTWFFDAHLLDAGWHAPRCVSVCPTGAIEAVKTDDATMSERAAREGLRTLAPERGTRPRVHYRNLQRIDHAFVGGSVVAAGECAHDVEVRLEQAGRPLATTRTDTFGDFRFDGLQPGHYSVRIDDPAGSAESTLELGSESVVLGDLHLRT
ncbi:MAG: oxidoreductase [Proteobacteria bacterium]|nr:oxidoreductase [Pseudomonadota bacterium]